MLNVVRYHIADYQALTAYKTATAHVALVELMTIPLTILYREI